MSLVETRTRKDGVLTVSCQHCGTALAEIQEDGRKARVIECEHFRWERVSTLCFHQYWYSQECDADYIYTLRRKYLLRINDGEMFFLLVPREAGER